MKDLTICFRIVESMMFRGPGEFDPYVRGVHSRALSLALPTPSTIAGSLATYCISQLDRPIPAHEEWIDQYLSVLGSDIKIRGPVVSLNGEILVYDKCTNGLLKLHELKIKCESEYKKLKKVNNLDELEKYFKLKTFKPEVKLEREPRIGVKLEVRDKEIKLVKKEGGLYGVEYIDYMYFMRKKRGGIEVLADIKGGLTDELYNRRALIKLGGETRISLMNFYEGNHVFNRVRDEIWHGKEAHNGIFALYLVTPALFKGGRKVEDYIREWAKERNLSFKGISGETEPLGAGFSLNKAKRKPIYISLKSGSIMYLEGEVELSKAYWEFSFGEGTQIGYGTIFPIPLQEV